MKTRLFFVCGLSEVLTCSLLRSLHLDAPSWRNVLVIYGQPISMPELHVQETTLYADLFSDWDQIIDLTGAGVRLPDSILGLLATSNSVVIHTLWNAIERAFLAACPAASIVMFDNGLDSHTERQIAPSATGTSSKKVILASDLERTDTAFYMLGDYLPIPSFIRRAKVIVPSATEIRTELTRIGNRGIFSALSPLLPQPFLADTLIVGTSFARTGRITPEAEIQAYTKYGEAIAEAGHQSVFKEHPRAHFPTFDISTPNIQTLCTSIPIEFIPCMHSIRRTASISSSALLMLKKIHNIDYELLAPDLAENLKLPWMAQLQAHSL